MSATSKTGGGSVTGEGAGDLDAVRASPLSLADHLETQLDLATADRALREAGRYIIRSLSEAGYLVEDTREIAEALGCDVGIVLTALRLVQGLDPPGIAARDLAECLRIQLRERGRLDQPMETLLARLDLVARRDEASLRRLCGVDEEALNLMLAELRSLDPKPGLAFGEAPIASLAPDLYVRVRPDGQFDIELNGLTVPRLVLDRAYQAEHCPFGAQRTRPGIHRRMRQKRQLAYAQSSTSAPRRSSRSGARSCGSRAHFSTTERVTCGRMNLRSIAEAIGMHESTISRVTANKAIGSDLGTFPMKYFFSAALNGADGASPHSSEAVRHRIKAMIASENGRSGAVRRCHCAAIAFVRRGHRATHRRQIPRGIAHSFIGAAAALPSRGNVGLRLSRLVLPGWKPHHRGQERLTREDDMTLRVSGKNLDIGEALQAQVEDRVESAITKYFNGGYSGHVTVARDGTGFRTDCVLHLTSGMTLEASGNAQDAYASFDQTAERIEKRLRRYKRRLKEHSASAAARANGRQVPYLVFESPTDETFEEERITTPSWWRRPPSRCTACR